MKKTKKAIPHRVHAAAVIIRRGRVLLALRPSNGLLGGMWEFPNARVDGDPARELTKAIRSAYNLRLRVKRSVHPLAIVEHTYSHFKVVTHAFRCELSSAGIPGKNLKWVALKDLKKYPMGRIDRQLSGKSVA